MSGKKIIWNKFHSMFLSASWIKYLATVCMVVQMCVSPPKARRMDLFWTTLNTNIPYFTSTRTYPGTSRYRALHSIYLNVILWDITYPKKYMPLQETMRSNQNNFRNFIVFTLIKVRCLKYIAISTLLNPLVPDAH